jgi:hypothetical protein
MGPTPPSFSADSLVVKEKVSITSEELDLLHFPSVPPPCGPQLNHHDPSREIICGVAFPLRETGSDLLLWAIQADSDPGYHGVRCIGAGDLLSIASPEGAILFAGRIDPDYETGAILRREFDFRKAIRALNSWTHWSQRGWSPNDWARLFLDETNRVVLHRISEEQPMIS